jgi:hypothetical protein
VKICICVPKAYWLSASKTNCTLGIAVIKGAGKGDYTNLHRQPP